MAEKDIDVLLVTFVNNACYLTDYQTPLSNWHVCIAIPRDGEMVAHVLDLEEVSLFVHGWPKDAPCYSVPYYRSDTAHQEVAEIVRIHGWSGNRIGLETRLQGCTHDFVKTLTEALPDATFVDASRVVLDCRMVKSRAEVDVMRQAGVYTHVGITAALNAVRAGITDSELSAVASEALLRAGSEFLTIEPLVHVNDAVYLEHSNTRRRVLLPGELFTCEMTGVYHRYSCPIYRTASVGKPHGDTLRLLDTANATLERLFELAKPGVPAKEIALELKAVAESKLNGLTAPKEFYGYAVGIGFPPDWVEHSFFIETENEEPLQAGMTFHSPHGYRVKDRKVGAAFSETWVVTENGGEKLTITPRELTIAH